MTDRPQAPEPDAEAQWCYRERARGLVNPALEGCTGKGRPTCTATECMIGAEPCPNCNGFMSNGGPCNWCAGKLAALEAKLAQAEARIEELEAKLATARFGCGGHFTYE